MSEDKERQKLVDFFTKSSKWLSVIVHGYANELTPTDTAIRVMEQQQKDIEEMEGLLKMARTAFIELAPSIAILSRDERHAPSTREEMLSGEKKMLEFLRGIQDRGERLMIEHLMRGKKRR